MSDETTMNVVGGSQVSTKKITVGDKEITLETGRLAKQASGSVVVRSGDTMVLVTAVVSKSERNVDFFPLTVDIEEGMYAAGKIPGGFMKKEGRFGDGQSRRRSQHGQRVIRIHAVHRKHCGPDVRFLIEPFRPHRADWPVNQTGIPDGIIAGAPFFLHEPTRDLPGRVHALFDIHSQREEVHIPLRLGNDCGDQNHSVTGSDHHRTTGLLSQAPGFQCYLLVTNGNLLSTHLRATNYIHRRLVTHSAFTPFRTPSPSRGAPYRTISYLYSLQLLIPTTCADPTP